MKDQLPNGPEQKEEQREDEILYAGDANMIIDLDATHQLTKKLLNYGPPIATRDVKIHWGKVGTIARLREKAR